MSLNSKKKILFFTSRIPFPLEKGDKLRAFHQIKHLSKDYEVVLCAISSHPITPSAKKELGKYTSSIHIYRTTKLTTLINMVVAGFYSFPFQVGYFFNTGADYFFKKVIEQENPDHIFVQLLRMAEYALSVPNIPKSLDYMDTFSKGVERRMLEAKGFKRVAFKIEYNRLKKYEEKIFDYFNNCFIISQQDKDSFSFAKAKEINVLPNGVDYEFFKPDERKAKKYDLVFTGNMSYPPNINAVVYIAEQIMPIIIKQIPNVKFLIAGATPSSDVKALQSDNIHVSGWLDDIRDAYNESKVFLAPLQIGTGLQNKLLEAMAMKLPCITSSLANNAIGATHRKNILIGNTPKEYAELVMECLLNDEKSRDISEAAKLHITQNFNWPSLSNELGEMLFPSP